MYTTFVPITVFHIQARKLINALPLYAAINNYLMLPAYINFLHTLIKYYVHAG